MSSVENINPEKEPIPASWVPRVITGGKGPPKGPDHPCSNWLETLEVGSQFACRQNEKSVDWEVYLLSAKVNPDLYFVKWLVPDGKIWERHIDPKLFCNIHRDYKVLWVHRMQVQEEQEE